MARVLFHIDLNAFFASAEELRHPEYKDRPMAVGSLSSRGVLSTANYAARTLGIHSAMPVFQARQLDPDLIIVPGDHAYYRRLSGEFFRILRRFSPMLEPVSIDECFLDVTDPIRRYKRPLDLAVAIQTAVYEELGLKCSIGVAPNRFLAKMASDMRKPMGITVLRKSEVPAKLWPLDISDMVGIGKKTVPLLKKAGVDTIGDLADPENEEAVRRILGKNALSMIRKARGNGPDKLEFSSTHKSISVSRTLTVDIYTLEESLSFARDLCRELVRRLQKEGQKGMLISVVFRDVDFRNKVRSRTLEEYTDQFEPVFETVQSIIEQNFVPEGYRHMGVSMGSLQDADKILMQPTIFEPVQDTARDVVNLLNRKFDQSVFTTAGDLLKQREEKGAQPGSAGVAEREQTASVGDRPDHRNQTGPVEMQGGTEND